jgi:hypothetical protein
MSETTPCLITNLRAQPLELHLAEQVMVLEPYGQVDVTEADLSSPQIISLRDRHLISVQQVSPLEPSNQGESGHEL